jgi:hypothetical protein
MIRQGEGAKGVFVLLLVCCNAVVGQTTGTADAESIFSEQARSIAQEIVAGRHLDLQGRVLVSVEGGTRRAILENALLEVVASKGGKPLLSKKEEDVQNALEIFVLRQDIQLSHMGLDSVARVIATILEARLVYVSSGEAQFLGKFERVYSDTIPKSLVIASEKESGENSSFLNRALTPAILIGGTVLAVYLLFTVRSP